MIGLGSDKNMIELMVKMHILQGILLKVVQMLMIKIMPLIFMPEAVMAHNVDQWENILLIFQNIL